jgi:hypothetical protein
MRDFVLTMSGWLAAAIFCTALIVPWGVYALRISGRPRKRFMALHLVLGIAVPMVGLAHGALPISAAGIAVIRKPALALGVGALLLLLVQAGLGVALRDASMRRPQLRSAHLATMLALAGLILVHILAIRA